MDLLIVKLFGLTRLNFVTWLVLGLFVGALALFLTVFGLYVVVHENDQQLLLLGVGLLLTAVCVLLGGIFAVLLTIYCALVAEKLEKASPRPAGEAAAPAKAP
jgi:hypothetical protein